MEAYVIALKPKDDGIPNSWDVSESQNGEMPLVWHRSSEATRVCKSMNGDLPHGRPDIYSVYKVSITILEEC